MLNKINLKHKYKSHIILWLLFLIIPISFQDNIGLIASHVPVYFAVSFLTLIGIFYALYLKFTPQLLLKNKIFQYLGIIIICFLVYIHLPRLICNIFPENDLTRLPFDFDAEFRMKMKLGILLIYLVIVIGLSIIVNLRDVQQVNLKLENEKKTAELALLKSQVNPHFLFNSLNSIYYLAIEKTDEAPKAIIALSDMMRYVLTEASVDFVSLEKEVDYIQKYINLQKLRLPKNTTVNSEIEIIDEELEIAPLLLIPFIENAFKYGVSARKKTTIDIQIKSDNRQLWMKVNNTIVEGFSEATNTKIGIENVKKQLNHIYPNRHTLTINNENGLFKVELNLILANEG